jgi:pseudolysin
MRVHYGKNYANAFWDGTQMSFGDGDYSFYPLVALSIGAHEISHGFTEQHSNLVYFGQSGAINEAFSDMAAQAAEYYIDKKNSWKIGHDIIKSTSPMAAIRFMDKPSLDKHSIEFAHHYRDGMDVHYSSGVYNKLFYLIATTPNWDTQKAFKLMLKANMDYWIPTATFSDAACGIIYAAKDLKYSIDDVQHALEEVIIDYDNC